MEKIWRFADLEDSNSLRTRMVRKRFNLFKSFISSLPRPLRILDAGGMEIFWEQVGATADKTLEVTLLNLTPFETHHSNFTSMTGDARNLHEFKDGEFDIVFSNSVIEHVGEYEDQQQMANEAQRVGKRFFLQTPNFYFPFEPHFFIPFFQFFPLWLRVFFFRHFSLGWYDKLFDKKEAIKAANSVRLLKKRELKELFPGATILKERFWGLTYAFILYGTGQKGV